MLRVLQASPLFFFPVVCLLTLFIPSDKGSQTVLRRCCCCGGWSSVCCPSVGVCGGCLPCNACTRVQCQENANVPLLLTSRDGAAGVVLAAPGPRGTRLAGGCIPSPLISSQFTAALSAVGMHTCICCTAALGGCCFCFWSFYHHSASSSFPPPVFSSPFFFV